MPWPVRGGVESWPQIIFYTPTRPRVKKLQPYLEAKAHDTTVLTLTTSGEHRDHLVYSNFWREANHASRAVLFRQQYNLDAVDVEI